MYTYSEYKSEKIVFLLQLEIVISFCKNVLMSS